MWRGLNLQRVFFPDETGNTARNADASARPKVIEYISTEELFPYTILNFISIRLAAGVVGLKSETGLDRTASIE